MLKFTSMTINNFGHTKVSRQSTSVTVMVLPLFGETMGMVKPRS